MRERGWSQSKLFEEVGEDLGYGKRSRAGFLPLLVKREPTPAQAEVLRRHFGEPAPLPEPKPVADQSDLAAAIREQTKAINDLVGLLRPLVQDATEGKASRLREVEAVVKRLAEQALAGPATQHVQPESGR